jgi:hypothetical protein
MTTPVPPTRGIAEYKDPSRKSSVYSPWRDVPWDEQRALGGDFEKAGEGCWPVEKILQERKYRRGNHRRTEYLVLWKRHPETQELWAPQWVRFAPSLAGNIPWLIVMTGPGRDRHQSHRRLGGGKEGETQAWSWSRSAFTWKRGTATYTEISKSQSRLVELAKRV